MNRHMPGPMARLLVFGAALAVCVPLAAAQVLRDPTRPAFFSGRTGEGGMTLMWCAIGCNTLTIIFLVFTKKDR